MLQSVMSEKKSYYFYSNKLMLLSLFLFPDASRFFTPDSKVLCDLTKSYFEPDAYLCKKD